MPLALTPSSRRMTAVAGLLAAVSLGIGLGANFIVEIAGHAAREALDRTAYVNSVRALNAQPEEGKYP